MSPTAEAFADRSATAAPIGPARYISHMTRTLILLLSALTLVAKAHAQDEDSVAAPVRELLQCRAGWHRSDTVHLTIRNAQHSTDAAGVTTATGDNSYHVVVNVLDSGANGYRLRWQRRQHDLGMYRSMMPAIVHSVMDSVEALEVVLVTDVNGTLLGIENHEEVTARWAAQAHRLMDAMVGTLPPDEQPAARERLGRWEQQSAQLNKQLLEGIQLCFMPYGMNVYNDTLYTWPYIMPNTLTGGSIPGTAVSELVHVDADSYRMDMAVLVDPERFREEVRKGMNRMNKMNGAGRRVGRRAMPPVELTTRYTFVLDAAHSWPRHFTGTFVSSVEGQRTERSVHITRGTGAAQEAPLTELELDALIADDPHDPRPYRNRGWLREQRDDHAGAIEDYTMALTMDSAHANTWMLRGYAHQQSNQRALALADLDRAVALAPQDPDNVERRARILIDLHRYPEAERDLRRALELDSTHRGSLLAYGFMLKETYHFEEALGMYDRVVAAYPDRASSYGQRASARFHFRDPVQDSLGLVDLRTALALDPDEDGTLTALGNRYLDTGRNDSAIFYFDRILTLDPNDAVAMHNRGYAKLQLGRYEDAIADMRESLDMDSTMTYAHNNIGWALHLAGRSAEGLASIDHAIARMPTNAFAFYNRGRVLAALGRTTEACEAWAHAEAIGFSKAYGDAVLKEMEARCR